MAMRNDEKMDERDEAFMILQISAGNGPIECEFAVGKLFDALQKEYGGIQQINCVKGKKKGCFRSIRFSTDKDMTNLTGSIKWMCKSPFRPSHKRKNWFIEIYPCFETAELKIREEDIRFDTFRSGGRGGQHVNKVETGVRAVHIPTGLSAICMDSKSQSHNRKLAQDRLVAQLKKRAVAEKGRTDKKNWYGHYALERGNPIRVYKGKDFILTNDGMAITSQESK